MATKTMCVLQALWKASKLRVENTPKNKNKEREIHSLFWREEFGEKKIELDFWRQCVKMVIRSWAALFPLWHRLEEAAEFNRVFSSQ